MRKKIKFFVVFLLIIILPVCYARYVEPEMLVVKEISVDTQMEIEDCKIVFFSDTHFGALYDETHMKKIADKINKIKADIVIFAGDLLDNYARDRELLNMESLQRELSRIEAKIGKYAVIGNHDYGGGAIRIYKKLMDDSGFCVLDNETVVLEKQNIEIIGFDDYLLGYTEPDFYHVQSDRFHIIAAHEPIISKLVECNSDSFILSGHTHGGQIFVPYITKRILPTGSDCFVRGLYTIQNLDKNVQMYVSSGVGLTKYPFRFLNIPEIIEINISKKE